MLIKFGIDTIDLKIGVDCHNLLEGEEITNHRNFCQAGQLARAQKNMKDHALPEETQEKMLNEAKELGKPSVKNDGTLTYDFLLQLSQVMEKHIISCPWFHERHEQFITDRRAKLAGYDKSEALK